MSRRRVVWPIPPKRYIR